MLASEIEPRNYALSLKAEQDVEIAPEVDLNENNSIVETGLYALIILTVSVYLIMHFCINKEQRRIEIDDDFQKQADEEVPLDRPHSASASFSKSFDFLTVKTEKTPVFKPRSQSMTSSNSPTAARSQSFNLTGILKRENTTSYDSKSRRKSPSAESTGSETLNEDKSRSSFVRRVRFS